MIIWEENDHPDNYLEMMYATVLWYNALLGINLQNGQSRLAPNTVIRFLLGHLVTASGIVPILD